METAANVTLTISYNDDNGSSSGGGGDEKARMVQKQWNTLRFKPIHTKPTRKSFKYVCDVCIVHLGSMCKSTSLFIRCIELFYLSSITFYTWPQYMFFSLWETIFVRLQKITLPNLHIY